MTGGAGAVNLHAGCVAFEGRGILILGPSGSGKSALALDLMALGCRLVSDDRTDLVARDGRLFASAPAILRGVIEARGIGLLRADPVDRAEVALAVDLGQTETERLPPRRHICVCGVDLPLLLGPSSPHFPAAVLQYLRGGRAD
ncbi:MAG: HPr kinase/phosphorylase [Pseudomonadota bacterium]